MLRVVLEYFRPSRPHLVDLRRIFDEIARHTRSTEARIFYVREHAVQRVPELVKRGPDLVECEQRRLAGWRFRNIKMVRDNGLGAEQSALPNVLVHPGATAL